MDEMEAPKKKFRLLPTGAEFDENINFAEWEQALSGIMEIRVMSPIWLGDALNAGEKIFGETYSQAQILTGLSIDSLSHYKSVMSRTSYEVRRPGLSLSHYRVTAALPLEDQKKYLDEAKASNLSVRDLGALVGARALKIEPPCGGCGEFRPLQIFRLCETCADKVSEKGDQT